MGAAVFLSPSPILQFFGNNGLPNAGGSILTQVGGINYPTYQDSGGNTPLPNPIPLNSRGEISNTSGISSQLFLVDGVTYTFTQYDINGNQINQSQFVGSNAITNASFAAGSLNYVVSSIAALRALTHSSYATAFVTGYYAPHDGGGGAYQYDSSDTTSADNGGTIIVANDGGRWKLQYITSVSVKQFGAKGDSVTDDTNAINAAINALPAESCIYFPPGTYNVTSLTLGTSVHDQVFDFDNAWLFGISTSSQNAILNINGANNLRFRGLKIMSDGTNNTPTYALNYSSAIQMTCGSGFNSCFIWFESLEIRYMKAGIVNGAFIGNSAQPSGEASEIWINNATFRGVLQPIYCNAINGYVVVKDSCIAAQQFESGSWFATDYGQGFCVRNENLAIGQGNHILLQGCEFQRADGSTGNWLYGGNIVIQGMVWEVAQTAFLTGDVSISGDIDGFFGPGATPVFTIAGPGSTGTLLLENFRCDRPSGTAATDRTNFVSAVGSLEYNVAMVDCHLREWFYTANDADSQLVAGCQFSYERLTIDNATTNSWYLDSLKGNAINNADLSSHAISTTGSTTAQGGWTCNGTTSGNVYQQLSGDSPFSTDTSCFQIVAPNSGFVLETSTTTRFNVEGNRQYTVEMPCKNAGSGAGATVSMGLTFFDFAGNNLGTVYAGQLDQTTLQSSLFSSWTMWRGPVVAPPNACTASFAIGCGPNVTFRFYHPVCK